MNDGRLKHDIYIYLWIIDANPTNIVSKINAAHVGDKTVFVCVCVFRGVCPDDLIMKDWWHTNNISQAHSWKYNCASDVSATHDVTDDVSRSQSRSNSNITIKPSISEAPVKELAHG